MTRDNAATQVRHALVGATRLPGVDNQKSEWDARWKPEDDFEEEFDVIQGSASAKASA